MDIENGDDFDKVIVNEPKFESEKDNSKGGFMINQQISSAAQ